MNTATAITIAALAALTPTVTCLIGIVLARQDLRELRAELVRVTTELRADMIDMRKDVHADLLMIHERVANVEGRQGR